MEFLKKWYEKLKPDRWYSWQTAFLLSAISCVMSILAETFGKTDSLVATLIAYCGWIFLIAGISWWSTEEYPTFSPWITGAALCIFFFGSFSIESWGWAVAVWPIISAIVYTLPYFWDDCLRPRIPNTADRIKILLVVGSQLLFSFWIQFFIVLSNFIEEYPSFYNDDLSESLFIVRTPNRSLQSPRGVFILELLDGKLVEHYEDKPWAEVDAEIVRDPTVIPEQLLTGVNRQITPLKEDSYWELQPAIAIPADRGYDLIVRYEWTGPQARQDDDYFVEKTCSLQPIQDESPAQRGTITAITCDPSLVEGWLEVALN
ncbi:MAG: DUF5357 family protein [Limnothrix sp.]